MPRWEKGVGEPGRSAEASGFMSGDSEVQREGTSLNKGWPGGNSAASLGLAGSELWQNNQETHCVTC